MAVTPQPAVVPVVPLLRQSVLFPSLVLRLSVDRDDTSALLSHLLQDTPAPHLVACVPLRRDVGDAADASKLPLGDLEGRLGTYGCLGKVLRVERGNDGLVAVIEGLHRVEVERLEAAGVAGVLTLRARVRHHRAKALDPDDTEAHSRLASLKASSTELITTLKGLKLPLVLIRRLEAFISKATPDSAGQLCDLMVSVVESSYADKVAVLESLDVSDRLARVHELVSKQLNTIKVSRKISSTVDQTMNKQQKEFILRQKLNAIKKELGQLNGEAEDGEGEADDAAEYRKRIDAAEMSVEARAAAEKELRRLKRMQPQQAEYQVIRTYLDTLLEIPWLRTSQSDALEAKSVDDARRILDEDHFGLERVKRRLVEYLAILRLRQTLERERPRGDVKVAPKL